MEQWIEAGRVLVNGKPAEVGLRVTEMTGLLSMANRLGIASRA